MPVHIRELISEVSVTEGATGQPARRGAAGQANDTIMMLRRREEIAARTAADGLDD
jgi:hypothetical protein